MCILFKQKEFYCFFLFAAECISTCHLMYSFFLTISFSSSLALQRFFSYKESNYNFFFNSFKLCMLLSSRDEKGWKFFKNPIWKCKKCWSSAIHFVATYELMASLSQKMYPATFRNKWEKTIGAIAFLSVQEIRRKGTLVFGLKMWMKYLLCWVLTAVQGFTLWTGNRSNSNLNQTDFSLLLATRIYQTIHIACTRVDQKGAGLKSAIK